MVVGHFAVVEHLFALGQFLSCCCQLLYQGQVFLLAVDFCLTHTIENLRTFGVDVVGKKLGVHTRIGSKFLLVEALYELERHVGRIAELLVAVHLQRCEVVEVRWRLGAFLLGDSSHGEGLSGDGAECFLAFLLAGEFTACGSKLCVAIDGGKHPVGFWLEVVDFFLSVHDECKGGSLHTSYAEHLSVLSVFQGV